MSTVEVIALKPFVYSTDGYTEIHIGEKHVFDLPERFFQGLNDARFVRRATIGDGRVSLKPEKTSDERLVEIADMTPNAQSKRFVEAYKAEVSVKEAETNAASDVEIPDDWQSLKFFALRSLASKLGHNVKTMGEAVVVIEAELAKRNKG